jgi:c-di-GMP-binding flagellar brake protein YcgR
MNDRREYVRISGKILLEYSLLDKNDSLETNFINISASGVRFLASKEFRRGNLLDLRITLPLEDPLLIPAIGEVIRVEKLKRKPGYFITAIKFYKIDKSHKEKIVLYSLKNEKKIIKEQRRGHIRIDDRMPVKYSSPCDDGYFETNEVNISGSGIRLKAEKEYPVGTAVKLKIKLPTSPREIIPLLARVVRVEQKKRKGNPLYITALHFSEIKTADREKIIQYVFQKYRTLLRAYSGRI